MSQSTVSALPNAELLDELYQRWCQDPDSVEPSWRNFFEGFQFGMGRSAASFDATRQIGIVRLIFAYRDIGHAKANLDPIGFAPRQANLLKLLELDEFKLTEKDLDAVVDTAPFFGLGMDTLKNLINALEETYCRSIGVEYMHIQDIEVRRWLQQRMEPIRNTPTFQVEEKRRILESLAIAAQFEDFLQKNYNGQKRFSLEGAETLIPMMETLVELAPTMGVREIVIGMPHRGRLNVLANVMKKPVNEIFAQFEEGYLPAKGEGDGDVKYHLGAGADRVNLQGQKVHVSLTPNPSHLEAVNPVVEGRVRAKQTRFGDLERRWGLPVLLHGDAAFAGQGLVAETLNLSQLEGFTTGGTIHIIVNNQIGFTTIPQDGRSTPYCTDVAKMLQCPIFHVNAEDPEAVLFVTQLALEYRQEFRTDVVIDLYCYRFYGHNETDAPEVTLPTLYAKIKSRPPLSVAYGRRLEAEGVVPEGTEKQLREKYRLELETIRDNVRSGPKQYPLMHGFEGAWKGMNRIYSHDPVETGVPEETLRRIAAGLCEVPRGFSVNRKIAPTFASWKKAIFENKPILWGLAESLAYGSLLLEKHPVRLTGQDVRRGTFSHRHAAIYDDHTGERYVPLANLSADQALFEVYDSLLSEAAVLGFEFGYSMDLPNALVIWEAQFGDFVNGAQVIIDQFLASSESKWNRDSGVVLFLPHGYEGQGPEHSSARLERFLQLCAEDNMQVVSPTTPAQHFHLLRRQLKRNFRKPLVVMTPKSLLRAEMCFSTVADLTQGCFHEVIFDDKVEAKGVKRVIFCAGKLYYDLNKYRNDKGLSDVALVRVEQMYPFPEGLLREAIQRYHSASTWLWAQEESHNNGAWFFMEPRLRQLGLEGIFYVGRDDSASPATGSHAVHTREQAEVIESAFTRNGTHLVRASSFESFSAVALSAATESHSPTNGQHSSTAAAQAKSVAVQKSGDKTPAAPAAS
jgi:2-oxoglutarate dehydrogenase E1 component